MQGRDLIPDLLCEEGEACDPQRRIQVWPGSQGSCTSTSLDLSPRVENNGGKKKTKGKRISQGKRGNRRQRRRKRQEPRPYKGTAEGKSACRPFPRLEAAGRGPSSWPCGNRGVAWCGSSK